MRIVACAVVIGAVLAAIDARAGDRAAVPSVEEQIAAKKVAGEIYAERFREAKTDAQKIALAKEILAAAQKIKAGSADQYVTLTIARDIAAGAGDAETAMAAAAGLVGQFDVPAARTKAETLLAVAKKASYSAQHKALAEAAGPVVDESVAGESYDIAIQLCNAAQGSARQARLYPLAKELAARAEGLEAAAKASKAYAEAMAVLDKSPTDPAANLAAGRYLCLARGDWTAGVSLLALGSDPELKQAAEGDLKGAESAADRAARGDAWWDLAEKAEGTEKDALMLHAGSWYQAALPGLSGLLKIKIQKRIEQIGTERIPPLAGGGEQLVFKFDDRAATEKHWEWSGDWDFGPDGAKAPKGPRSFLRSKQAYGADASIDMEFSFGRATFTNTGGCWIMLGDQKLLITNAWGPVNAKIHIQRDGGEIVYTLNGQESRVPVAPDAASKPAPIEVVWRSRTSHFRRIEIKAKGRVEHLGAEQSPPPGGNRADGPFEQLTGQLNDLSQWSVKSGDWKSSGGQIIGSGNSSLQFKHDLPADFVLQFKMNVLKGLRPRVRLRDFYFGTEGFRKSLFIPKKGTTAEDQRFDYKNDQEFTVRATLRGEQVSLEVNGKTADQAKRAVPPSETIELSAGDGWSPGSVAFSEFQIQPVTKP